MLQNLSQVCDSRFHCNSLARWEEEGLWCRLHCWKFAVWKLDRQRECSIRVFVAKATPSFSRRQNRL